jgi:Kef-type K+ transport system membrane component KefB
MNTDSFFLQLLIILLAARILGEAVARLKIPAVIGEICAGILIGPSLLGWLEPDQTIRLLAEIGIVLLLFEVGIETDISKLMQTGFKPLIAALAGVIVPFVAGFAVSFWAFHLSLLVAFFIGGALTATSIGITVRVLTELNRQHSREAQIVIGAAVVDDIIGVILLAMLYNFSEGGGVSMVATGKVMLSIGIFVILAPFAAKLLSLVIQRFEAKSEIPGMIPASIVSMLLFFAWVAHASGAPELLGGFAAGLALTPRFALPFSAYHNLKTDHAFVERIETQMKPIVHLFSPIFFVMVGLSLNLRSVDWSSGHIWALALSLLAVAIVGKLASGFFLPGEKASARWMIGIAMIPRGEVGLIFAELGRVGNILDNEIYAALIIVIAATTLLSPFALRFLCSRSTDSTALPTASS